MIAVHHPVEYVAMLVLRIPVIGLVVRVDHQTAVFLALQIPPRPSLETEPLSSTRSSRVTRCFISSMMSTSLSVSRFYEPAQNFRATQP